MKEKHDYIVGITPTRNVVIGKLINEDDIDKPYELVLTREETIIEGQKIPAGMILLLPFIPPHSNCKILKRKSLMSETFDIEEKIVSSYQKMTSQIAQATLADIHNINAKKDLN